MQAEMPVAVTAMERKKNTAFALNSSFKYYNDKLLLIQKAMIHFQQA